jgi:hypothetical protein
MLSDVSLVFEDTHIGPVEREASHHINLVLVKSPELTFS